jgi:hypothetical protein
MKVSQLLFIILCTFSLQIARSQEVKKETDEIKTKMDLFTSKTGSIMKFVDFNLPKLKASFENAETRIRKITNGSGSQYFYQIVKKGQYSNSTASIEYSDLIEVIKAIKSLQEDEGKDITSNPDYLENKFISEDGFEVGYYIEKGKSKWYIKLERYGSGTSLFIDKSDGIEAAFNEAKAKIDEIKK